MKHASGIGFVLLAASLVTGAADRTRALKFDAASPREARRWQHDAREKLFALMMGGREPKRGPLKPQVLQRLEMPAGGYVLEELTLQTLPDRRVHAWLARPAQPRGKVGAVLALHGHGGTGEQIVRGLSLYWFGRALAEMGYVVISPDIGQHELQHTNWTLMGERTWDALRCLDYVATLPEVDPTRLAVAGLSLGGETTMYVAALDERVRAVCSSGWLTTVENMKNGHCPCFNFPGLEENFDFADLFACVAPRPLVLELGEKERAPGGFPVEIGRRAFAEIQAAYRVFGAEANATLTVHPAGHVFNGQDFWPRLHDALGMAWPWSGIKSETRNPKSERSPKPEARRDGAPKAPVRNSDFGLPSDFGLRNSDFERELVRRGEIARRLFTRALGVLDGWGKTRDATTGLYPRRVDQPLWAPSDNAADLLPFLALTAHFVAPERLPEVLDVIPKERALTTRLGGLPDWFALTNRAFLHPTVDTNRLIFCAAEYCKDGLIPMTEVLGRGPWFDRMVELMDAIFAHAPVATEFGQLPADDAEVNGDILQTLARLYCATRESKYLQWAERIGDAFCFEVLPKNGGLPPHRWDFAHHRPVNDTLNLNDHGNEIVGGLAELFVVTLNSHPEKAARYQEPLRAMFRRLLDKARNSDGLWFNLLKASTAEPVNRETPDTWGYALSAAATFGLAAGGEQFVGAARQALRHIDRPRYLDWNGADAYADSIEGSLYLLNRFPTSEGFAWLEKVLPIFLSKQRDDGIVEGWYGDGNYARTALLAALYYTQGVRVQPWSPKLRFGAVREGDTLRVVLHADEAWEGRITFDRPRHRLHLNLPMNYPRLNEFPEWFAVEPLSEYRLKFSRARAQWKTGTELAGGIPVRIKAGATQSIVIRRL
jgi:dienelactone hydrolase